MSSKCKPLFCICGIRIPMRIVTILLCGLGAIVAYGHRTNINVAITRLVSQRIRNLSFSCRTNATSEDDNIEGGTKNWTELTQGYILGSFYVGYLVGQVPSGILADKYGPRWIYMLGNLCSSLVCLSTPLIITYTHWGVVIFSRILTGAAQAGVFPCIGILVSRWVPFEERSTLGAFTYTSASMGVILGNIVSGFIIFYTNNWPNVFYFWGIFGLLWCVVYLIYCYSDYEVHPHLPERERNYLRSRIKKLTRLKPPWKKILTDKGVIALIMGQIGHDMTLFLCVTNIPKYFSEVVGLGVRDVSVVSSLPFAGTWISGVIAGRVCDYINVRKHYSLKWNRGITTYISFAITNTFLVLMMYAGCNVILAITSYSIAVFFMGPFAAGHKVNQMDITINFNGIVMSIVNGVGCISGFITPVFISLVAWKNTLSEWQIVAWFVFVVSGVSATYYMFMLNVHRAEWDVPDSDLEEWKEERDDRTAAEEKKKIDRIANKDAKKNEKGEKSI